MSQRVRSLSADGKRVRVDLILNDDGTLVEGVIVTNTRGKPMRCHLGDAVSSRTLAIAGRGDDIRLFPAMRAASFRVSLT